jgi:hypothetical protein
MTMLQIHVVLSLVGIIAGFIAVAGMVAGRRPSICTAIFLIATLLTSITAFLLPAPAPVDPPRVVGAISLVLMAIAIPALYVFRLARRWRLFYVLSAVAALYLNSFVAVIQTFQKVAFFNALAPTQSEPPFVIAQGVLLLLFVVLGAIAVKRFPSA